MLSWLLLAALAAPATNDAFVRLVLSVLARRWSPAAGAPARPAR